MSEHHDDSHWEGLFWCGVTAFVAILAFGLMFGVW